MKERLQSFKWAMNGFRIAWREEMNFRIEVLIAIVVTTLGVYFRIALIEWIMIAGCIGALLAAELVNTAIEDLCDKVEPNTDPVIGKVKDIMAAFVLVISLSAASVLGIILFAHLAS